MSGFQLRTSILPVTAAEIRAVLRSERRSTAFLFLLISFRMEASFLFIHADIAFNSFFGGTKIGMFPKSSIDKLG